MVDRPVFDRGRFYKLPEVAAILGVHITTVRRWVKGELLPAKRIGRQWFVFGGDLVPDSSAAQPNLEALKAVEQPSALGRPFGDIPDVFAAGDDTEVE